MDFVTAWKASSIVLTGFFGILGLVKDFKTKDGHVTFWGRVSLAGILASSVLGVAAQLKESSDTERDRKTTADQTLAIVKKSDATLTEIDRVLSPIDEPRFTASFALSCADNPKIQEYCRGLQKLFRTTTIQWADDTFRNWPLGPRPLIGVNISFFQDPADAARFGTVPDAESDWSIDLFPESASGTLDAFADEQGVTIAMSDARPMVNDVKNNGKIASVKDIPGSTMVLTLIGNEENQHLALQTFNIGFKNGSSVHCSGPFQRVHGLGADPAYRYTFPKAQR